ncbi:Putative protein of unknown function [Podospora comata]|uniref:3'-5' exonuclease domain-containing protein n=1 Tax=Podospora comata TaxID=48703 RepID=A0ABY6RY66_PODCO|nr:Putative protein of unknown function [Podospora comata]
MAQNVTIVDTTDRLSALLDDLINLPTSPPSLYLDLEGEDLSRRGTIAILQIHVHPVNETYLVDIHTLQNQAFKTSSISDTKKTLKSLLESPSVPKVFFDVRNDSDALFSLYGIRLAGVRDVQVMKHALTPMRRLNGLGYCYELDVCSTPEEVKAFKVVKEVGRKLFSPRYGGSYAVFSKRPMREEIVQYCAQDAGVLPRLWEEYNGRIERRCDRHKLRGEIAREEIERVRFSQTEKFGKLEGKEMCFGPKGEEWKEKWIHEGCCGEEW